MSLVRLPYVTKYVDRHGRVRRYFRRKGAALTPLPGEPGSAEFVAAYHAALIGDKTPAKRRGSNFGTVAEAVSAYYEYNSFRDTLSPVTQKARRAILERFRREHGDKPLDMLERPHIAILLGKLKPHPARDWLKTLRGFTSFCMETGRITEDPTEGIKRAKAPKSEGFHTWTEAEVAKYEKRWPIGTRERLAMALLIYTALRRSDVVRVGPQHFSGARITLNKTRGRTGKTLKLAVHPVLAVVLKAAPVDHETFLVTTFGKPFTAPGFGNWFRECCDKAGLPHCSAHGLKKAALRRVAEAGGSVHLLKGLGGHDTLRELDGYTRDAEQAKLAQAAVDLMAEAFPATDQERSRKSNSTTQ